MFYYLNREKLGGAEIKIWMREEAPASHRDTVKTEKTETEA